MTLKNFNPSEIQPSEWYSINRFILGLEPKSTSCVSVYYPHDKKLETIQLLKDTKRDKITEKIESSIEKRIMKLELNPKRQFANTYCVFGWKTNDKVIIKDITISKKLPYVYTVGKKTLSKTIL